jgi:hypothetical protein
MRVGSALKGPDFQAKLARDRIIVEVVSVMGCTDK